MTEEIEITEEMIEAGTRAFYESDPRFEDGTDRAILIYEAMVRASPGFLARSAKLHPDAPWKPLR
jgi:hypothetical protein